ncbi:MAG: NADH-quinone oxidoreductase subunit A [Planctomycetes bacterium]|nr:NADH-quinone oxidoreductase subunit A [Planctomycetota bacterium]
MEDNVLASLVIVAVLAVIVPVAMALLGYLLGPRRPSEVKYSVYECGIEPVVDAKRRFSVKFYQVAVLFVVFDVEVAFLFPWAISFRESAGFAMFGEMLAFLAILAVGLYYVIKRGALEWE